MFIAVFTESRSYAPLRGNWNQSTLDSSKIHILFSTPRCP